MKLVVTGAGGFIGNHLIHKLISLGHDVIALSRHPLNFKYDRLENINLDLREINELNLGQDIDAIFHVASKISFGEDAETINEITNNNMIVNFHLVNFILRHNIKKVILSSTCSVYEENYLSAEWITEKRPLKPQNLYAISKLAGEWILEAKLRGVVEEFVILRYSSVYGYGQRPGTIVPAFIQNALTHQAITIFGSGSRIQDYVYIDDVVWANTASFNTKLPFNTVLNIGSGQPITDKVLAETINKTWANNAKIKILDQQKNPETIFNYAVNKAEMLIGFKPIKLSDGLQLYKQVQEA